MLNCKPFQETFTISGDQMKERVSIKDVARKAGVSIATVSRVLADRPHIKVETKERVLRAIAELDYRPDQIARSLRLGYTNLIGFVVSTIENIFSTEVARAAEQTAHQHGYNLIVCNTDESPEREEEYLRILDQQMVAGVILSPAQGEGRHVVNFISGGMSIVLLNRRMEHLPCPCVTSDEKDATIECVTYLINEGRRRIAAVTGLPGISTTRERLSGYHLALAKAGLPLDSTLEVCGNADLEGGYKATVHLMQRENPPDAIFVFNNLMTQGVIMALQDLNIRWPDQVDVAGFGAFKTTRLYQPPLTLIDQPTYEMGKRVVETLIDQIEGRIGDEPEMEILHNRLIPRDAEIHLKGKQFLDSLSK
jgi:DNA-binding LacI/PurR family transcriptional regulator